MIELYSGTPGSGKSFHVAKKIVFRLRTLKKPVIATFDINLDYVSKEGKIKRIGEFYYVPVNEITPEYLYKYAMKNHVKGKEGQTLVIIDECQIIYNPRDFGRGDRMGWINFFTQHRHLGFDFVLVSQFDRLIDRQIRSLFEYEVKHRKVNNLGILFLLPFTCFVTVTVWYGVREKISSDFILLDKKLAKIYDSYSMFDKFMTENNIAEIRGVSSSAREGQAEGEEIENEIPVEETEPPSMQMGDRGSPSAWGVAGIQRNIRKGIEEFFTKGIYNAEIKTHIVKKSFLEKRVSPAESDTKSTKKIEGTNM